MTSAASAAEAHKLQGNVFFGQHLYDDAIREYGKAIIQNPAVPAYYTNRALCFLRLEQNSRAESDAERAIEIDSQLVKGHFFLGQALAGFDDRLEGALHALTKAHALSIEQRVPYVDEIAQKIREVKRRKWEIADAKRREQESSLCRYLKGLIEQDRATASNTLPEDAREESKADWDSYHLQLSALFTAAKDAAAERVVPDWLIGKISFEVMHDPVITPSGITYDRAELMAHLRKIGQFDPYSQQPMTERDVVPNLALKEAIDEFVAKNGWVIDY
ncbi:U-box domain-containing protein [Phlyctochytrium arcticum]|nr:U-box domain-containing protein [Phlyctochytrium arcticum]